MAHINEKTKNRKNKARERIEKRKQMRQSMATLANEGLDKLPDVPISGVSKGFSKLLNVVRDTIWHFQKDAPVALIAKIIGGFILVFVGFFFLTTLFSSNIGPNISTMGIKVSGQSVAEATEMLFTYWNEDVLVDIVVEGEVFEQIRPSDMGLSLDAIATAEAAKAAGLAGFPFGHEIEPFITSDYGDVQTYILGIANDVYIPPYEAGYEWRDGELVSVQGSASRELDTVLSIQRIVDTPLQVIMNGSVELVTTSTPPNVIEADPYYEQALEFVTSDFLIEGYDPFEDEVELMATTRQEMANWLVVTDTGLTVRQDSLNDFIELANSQLNLENWQRYLDPVETYEAVNNAFITGDNIADVRIRYADSTYSLQEGEWGIRLSRRIGLPFFNIRNSNPGVNWDLVFPGQNISIPSRDLVIPLDPVEDRRIIVDLDRRYLVAYENDEVIFHWPISVGMEENPTMPGVYQILSKFDVAYGSSFSLCNDNAECGQWEMNHFMGIYEVGFGLTNGFHGSVILPNGTQLTGGSAQTKTTFGCVMSDDAQAQLLYEWAETGVIVEMVDSVFPPESELGQQALIFINENQQSAQ